MNAEAILIILACIGGVSIGDVILQGVVALWRAWFSARPIDKEDAS